MTREDILQEILKIKNNNILLELPTGTGKSRIAIEKIKTYNIHNLLLVVNRTVHKQNWLDEFNKWWSDNNLNIIMTTYVSLPKYAGNYDAIIFDEVHHLSERCREALCNFNWKYSLLLSATVTPKMKDCLNEVFENIYTYKKSLRSVIEENILPDPKVYLIPLKLNRTDITETIIKHPKAKNGVLNVSYYERWDYIRKKDYIIKIRCTQKQYYKDCCEMIEFYKKKFYNTQNPILKNKWLKLCNDRLKWLSNIKTEYIKYLLNYYKNYRTLTFCSSIEQTEELGTYCINSKNKDSIKYLDDFNKGKINHITACNILNEGMNLSNCQIGIYANLNSSETIIKQKMGRLLRHKSPMIIIPYYVNTREEEIVSKMLEDYNPKLIFKVTNENNN